jgi:hypothetical protein
MDFLEIINGIITFFHAHLLISLAAVILLIFLAWQKPKFFFTVLFIALVLVGVLYLITYISDVGVSHKKELLHEKGLPWKNMGDVPKFLNFLLPR